LSEAMMVNDKERRNVAMEKSRRWVVGRPNWMGQKKRSPDLEPSWGYQPSISEVSAEWEYARLVTVGVGYFGEPRPAPCGGRSGVENGLRRRLQGTYTELSNAVSVCLTRLPYQICPYLPRTDSSFLVTYKHLLSIVTFF
jgi:hypothetical protein